MEILNIFLYSLVLNGVFGDEVKSVSVMEGQNVTLHTDLVKQKDDVMVWYYGPDNSLVAKINGKVGSTKYYEGDEGRFKDRLELNDQTGDLIISDMRTEHTGLYTLKISRNNKISYKNFNVNVHARLPVPVIARNSSQCSSSSSSSCCCVLCSVMNVSHDVSVSWYKGKSLLSSISVSDLNIRLSLPLEVEYQDTNTYRCVVNNPITNLTQHLNITQLCHMCEDYPVMMVIILSVVLLICVISMIIIGVCIHRRGGEKVSLKKRFSAEVPLTDKDRSSSSSATSEDIEASRFPHAAPLLAKL